jgi:hypothetical protein
MENNSELYEYQRSKQTYLPCILYMALYLMTSNAFYARHSHVLRWIPAALSFP